MGKCRVPAPTTIGPRATPHLICKCVTVRSLYVRIVDISLWSHVFGPPCTITRISATTVSNTTHWSQSLRCAQVINCKGYVVSRQDTNRNNTKCMLSVRHHYYYTPVTPCSAEHFLKCLLTANLRLYSRSHELQENCLYSECTGR